MSDEKLSREFSARLDRLKPKEMARVIVMLSVGSKKGRGARADRKEIIEKIRLSGQHAIPEIDSVLRQFGGRKLSDMPDALGCLAVETTASGVNALASLMQVKAIMEDQPIFLQH